MIRSILIANRGEIACRVIRTCREMGLRSIAVYSEADAHAVHVAEADTAICIGPPPAVDSYLSREKILQAAKESGADAIHPGYGFLSEDPEFADACEAAGIRFIGPTGDQMRRFGFKHSARELAIRNGAPLLTGTALLETVEEACRAAEEIGYPVMLKSTAGGGGIGILICRTPEELTANYESARRLNSAAFKASGVFLEKYVERARHIEVQIFGDGRGKVIALGERDCSTQRRNQKVLEETPAPNLDDSVRAQMHRWAVRLAESVNYRSAGTVEFLYDCDEGKFYFLEVNPRLQVEHCVTETVLVIDLVEWMIRLASGETLDLDGMVPKVRGHSIQARIYAEDPHRNFQPSCGLLTHVSFPKEARVDTWIESGTEVSPYYDPLLAKIIVHAETREAAVDKLSAALTETRIYGIQPNVEYLQAVVSSATFRAGEMTTRFLSTFEFVTRTIDVLEPGAQTLVQDFPGRLGYWAVGVPPSGPMDARAFQAANRIVGNPGNAAALEITMSGPALRFNISTTIALCGAPMKVTLDGKSVPFHTPVEVEAGHVLKIRNLTGAGARAYLAVRGGLDVPEYLGSRSTFALGGFGGHGGRALRAGDVLRLGTLECEAATALSPEEIPAFTNIWEIGVLYGPHGAPDFFTPEYIDTFFSAEWRVHYHSDRTGVRLIGPKPIWARADGGEAGLHPSNIHDNAYGVGSVDFTGDMPILLGPDGPSLGGFVCPAAIVESELWKMGQLKAGDTVRFRRRNDKTESPILAQQPEIDGKPAVVFRRSGDAYLLLEFGPLILDLNLRFRVHALMLEVEKLKLEGIIDLTPGIRSLQVHYDRHQLPREKLLQILIELEDSISGVGDIRVPSRIVHMPLSWEDPQAVAAMLKYMDAVRADAPWCPSNIEFIRRINGLNSIDEVREIIFNASYLVMGLGDVYLGAPVAVPLDPRHRLVTTKYNPARTWTPENAVGIGGAYMCVYGMEGPGGYQLFGRTIPVWNRFRSTQDFKKPWLLRFFDQIRFYPVSGSELLELREAVIHGKHQLHIEQTEFSLQEYNRFLTEISAEADAFRERQQRAFREERERWAVAPEAAITDSVTEGAELTGETLGENEIWVDAPVPGSVWKLCVEPGTTVKEGEKLAVLSAMKMEMSVEAPESGTVGAVLCAEGKAVAAGQHLFKLSI